MEFNNINEVYSYLEKVEFGTKTDWDFTSALRRLGDISTDEDVINKLKYESFVFDFSILNGDLKPMSSSIREDGITVFEYPSYNDFGYNGFQYLKERAETVQSEYLKARYNHVLWYSPKPHKHLQQAKQCIDAYFNVLVNSNCAKKESQDCIELIKSILTLSLQAKYRGQEISDVIDVFLFGRRKLSNLDKIVILNFLLDLPQFKKAYFTTCLPLVERIFAATKKKKIDFYFLKMICETGLKLAQKSKANTKIWNKRKGDVYLEMAEHRMNDETRMIPLLFLKDAMSFYKLAGLDKKVRGIQYRYYELKKELKLSNIELPLEDEMLDAVYNQIEVKTNAILNQTAEQIFDYLLSGADIFPKKKWLLQMAKDNNSAFADLFMTLKFDINNNMSKQKDSKEAKEKAKIYESYRLYLNLYAYPLLHRIFVDGIKNDKITFENLVYFIINNTWLGQELIDYDASGEIVKYSWLSLLAPSLLEYFKQTESALRSTAAYTNYIMPIDSLTLKFEGVLRDFAGMINVSKTTTGKGDVLREKYIEELLAEKEIQKFFDEDDILLFNYLFVAKDGMNLRNNIAHCFYRFNNYNFQIMHLLICAFLRIGKYKISTVENNAYA